GGRGSIRGSPRDWGNTHVWLSRVQLDIETLNWQRPFKHPSRSHVASKATARPARDVHQSLTCRLRADLGELHGPPLTPAPTLSTLSLLLTTMVPTGRRTPRSFQSRARTCDKKVATGLTQQKGGAAALVPNAETDSDSDKRKGMRRRRRRRRKEEGGGGCTQISLRCRTMLDPRVSIEGSSSSSGEDQAAAATGGGPSAAGAGCAAASGGCGGDCAAAAAAAGACACA
ncbi:unnamed protein product, partial [Prorocentrum cordatum]